MTGQVDDDAVERKDVLRRLYVAIFLCSCFIVVEVTGGLIAHSLAVLSDAAHLFADLASFAVAIAASYLASLPATEQHTFGLKRSESLAALFSMVSLVIVSVGLAIEAFRRLINPPETGVDGMTMAIIAGIGVIVNVILAWVLGGDHHHLPSHGGHDHSHDHGGHDDNSHDHHHHDDGHHDHHSDDDSHSHHDNGHQSHDHSNDHDHTHDHRADETTPLKACNGHHHDDHHHDHHNDDDHHDHHDDHDDDHHDHHDGHYNHQRRGRDKRNVNLRAAYLHVLADLAQSIAVFVGGLCIWWKPQYHIVDPILTLCFCVMVLYNAYGVLRSSVAVLLEEIPIDVDWQKVYDTISSVPNVEDVHDLHIWSISHGQAALSVHCTSSDPNALSNIAKACSKFGIKHATIQVQMKGGDCPTCVDDGCTGHLSTRNSSVGV